MRILFISGELIAGDLPYRLSGEGCDVKLFIENPAQQNCQTGFVQKIADWRGELDWVGKSGLIVFDDVGFGAIQDQLRRDGFRVSTSPCRVHSMHHGAPLRQAQDRHSAPYE